MKETRGRSLTRQVHQRLQERVREAGPRAERRIEEALGRRPGWLRDRRRTGAIELGLLLDALDYLDEDPRRFFRLALGEDEERDNARPPGEPPPIVRLVRSSLTEQPQGNPYGQEELEELDRLRYCQPYQVLERLEAAVTRTPRTLLPQLLGVAASTYRIALDFDQAEHAIAAAMNIAREHNDRPTIGTLLQRLSYISADRGNYAEALRLTERATGIHLLCHNLSHVGKSLVDQGVWLFYLKRPRDAILVQKAALGYLPDLENWNRFTALQNLGLLYQKLGEPSRALAYEVCAGELLPSLQYGSWPKGMVSWVRALISIDFGQLTEAEEHLREMIEIHSTLHFGETALATTELVRIQLLQAKPLCAYETAKSMLRLIELVRHNRTVSTAIVDLLRGGASDLTMGLVERVKVTLENARLRPSWRSLLSTRGEAR